MSDLTEHLRKAGKVKTEKKTLASRATIAEARKVLKAKRDAVKESKIGGRK
jgi:hypothetical protein